jgi:biopolymer transport protein ExbB
MLTRMNSVLSSSMMALLLAVTVSASPVAMAQDSSTPAQTSTAVPAIEGAVTPVQATDAATAAPAASVTTKEVVDNPYGLNALWAQGDFVAKGTLIILIIFSAGSWYILVTKLLESIKLGSQAREARQHFFKAANLQEGANKLKEGSAFRFVAEAGLIASEHHEGELTENIDRNTWITNSVQRAVEDVQSRLQNGLAFLATVGSTAPFIGLFGTVWGIYHALTAIGIAGQASIDKVAGPVGEALIMTAIGLAVAVPAVLGYNWLVRRNKVTLDAVRGFGSDLHGVLIGAKTAR